MIDALIYRMQSMLGELQAADDPQQYFLGTYMRTTMATRDRLRQRGFDDCDWVERWDVAFADLYLEAVAASLAGKAPTRPWAIAFEAPRRLPALRHVLLGMNAHVNFDLPQSLLAVISDDEFDDAALLARRHADHRAIDEILASRVAIEDAELVRIDGPGSLVDRMVRPFNHLGTQRFLRESRAKVWANTAALSRARRAGPERYAELLAELAELSAAKVAELMAPGQVVLRLAARGFGVRLAGA